MFAKLTEKQNETLFQMTHRGIGAASKMAKKISQVYGEQYEYSAYRAIVEEGFIITSELCEAYTKAVDARVARS